jgi:hypothetical protein
MEKNIHFILTDKPQVGCLVKYKDGVIGTIKKLMDKNHFKVDIPLEGISIENNTTVSVFNIYITSDDEIKEGDWYFDFISQTIRQCEDEQRVRLLKVAKHLGNKKIILTTDQDLIKDGVQGIEDSFLEWFINNPTCEEVEVQKWFDGVDFLEYKIIIPNDEYKQTDENGSPMTFWGGLKKHKKESIEEGAEAFAESRVELDPIYANGLYYGFIECGKSKWFQAEKIKAQIEENLSVLEMLKTHGTESSMFRVKMRIEALEQQLKQLE